MSNTPGVLIVASEQWQRHAQAFCGRPGRRSFFLTKESSLWLDWFYVAQQWMVVSQLLERYLTRASGEEGGEGGQFNEALLKVGHHIKLFIEEEGLSETTKSLSTTKKEEEEDNDLGILTEKPSKCFSCKTNTYHVCVICKRWYYMNNRNEEIKNMITNNTLPVDYMKTVARPASEFLSMALLFVEEQNSFVQFSMDASHEAQGCNFEKSTSITIAFISSNSDREMQWYLYSYSYYYYYYISVVRK